jgi:hypothetical protein
MKEKYSCDSVKDEISGRDIPQCASVILLVIAFIIRDYYDNKIFFGLIAISIFVSICWIGFYKIEGIFTADDTAVTFGRIFKKRMDYSSIKSITLHKELRKYRASRRNFAYLVEKITFHCEDGDYSFADQLGKEIDCKSPGDPYSLYSKDWSNSAFSRLKDFIESRNLHF